MRDRARDTGSPPDMPARAARWIVWLLVAFVATRVVVDVVRLDDGLSPIADAFSESNVVRAAEYHAVAGLLSDYGLSNTVYGRQFRREGHRGKGKDAHEVYTHYPPGPDLLASVARLAFGKGALSWFRSVPVAVGVLSLALLAAALLRVLTPIKAALLMAGIAALPLTHNMMAGLSYQGYALSLLWAQIAVTLYLFRHGEEQLAGSRLVGRAAVATFALGFIQGWMSFDYFFLVALAPLPLALLLHPRLLHPSGSRAARRHALVLVLAAGGGFACAHALHFAQVALFWGSVGEAYTDLMTSAAQRFDSSVREVARVSQEDLDPLRLARRYVTLYTTHGTFFGFSLAPLLGAVALLLCLPRLGLRLPGTGMRLEWRAGWVRLLPLALALVISLLWVVVMRQHSAIHTHFIPRHLFLAYFVALFLLLHSVERRPASGDA